MHDPVEPRAHQEDHVGLPERMAARRAHGQRMVVVDHAFAERGREERYLGALDEGADLVLGARPRHALADDDQRTLGGFERVQRCLDVLAHRLHPRRIGDRGGLIDVVLLDGLLDDVVRHVEIDRARPAVDRGADRLLDIEGNPPGVLDRVGEFAVGRGELDLVFLLERAHAVLIDGRGAADQDHRPAVLLGIGEAGKRVDDARPGDREARARPPGQVAGGLRGIGRRLLVAHADIFYADLLRRLRDRLHRKADDAEHVFDAVLLEFARHDLRAGRSTHLYPCPC